MFKISKIFMVCFLVLIFAFCGTPKKASAAYVVDVIDYVSWTEEKPVLIGDWEALSDTKTYYKTISFPHTYKLSGYHTVKSTPILNGLFYKRTVYKYYDYTTS